MALEKRLNASFEQRVRSEIKRHIAEVLMPVYGEKLARAEAVLNGVGKPVFSNSEYRLILGALHPDSDPERRSKAFSLFKEREVRLRKLDEKLTSNLPGSVAELLARRRPGR